MDKMWDHLYVHAVKGHLPRSKGIRGQVERWTQNVKFTSFEKVDISDKNQSWFMDIVYCI